MSQNLIDIFATDSYRLLCLLIRLQVDTLTGKRIRESQEEIAVLFNVSKGKLNPLMQSLEKAGCIKKHCQRSGYQVTPLGIHVKKQIEQIGSFDGRKNNG